MEPKRTIEELEELAYAIVKNWEEYKYCTGEEANSYEHGFIKGYLTMLEIYDAKLKDKKDE